MKKLFCFLLILLLLLVACRDDGDETDSVAADATPAEAVANEAPATATPPPAPTEAPAMIKSAGEMVGIWLRTLAGERDYIMYTADGRYLVALSQDNLATAPRVSGEYWFEDGLIHLRDLENAGYWTECDSETVGIYGVVDLGDDQMQFQVVDDGCGDSGFTRGYSFGNAKLEWIAEPVE